MVSVAIMDKRGPIAIADWSPWFHKLAERYGAKTLDCVGDATTDAVEIGGTCRIIRRQCKDDERRKVLEKFLEV